MTSLSGDDEPFQSAQIPQDQFNTTVESDSDDGLLSDDVTLDDPSEDGMAIPHDGQPRVQTSPSMNSVIISDEEAHDSDDSSTKGTFQTRPNRFHGSASTWRSWTAPERDLAASIDQLTAKDLSIHLYNAFKLKKRARVAMNRKEDGGADEDRKWEPPKVWTAWPLPPDIVPSEAESKQWEAGVEWRRSSRVKSNLPSEILGELLIAQVLRKARQRFETRDSESTSENTSSERTSSESPTSEDTSSENTRSESTNSEDSITPPAFDHGSKQSENNKLQRSMIMADDGRASEILQPTVQNIMTKFDSLLMGLHQARSSYLVKNDADFVSNSRSTARTASKSQRGSRKRNRSSSRQEAHTTDTSEAEQHLSIGDPSQSPPRSEQFRSSSALRQRRSIVERKQRLGLRDWSDVLGVAAMAGWDANVIERAASRCADLFGENMIFRTLEEGSAGFSESEALPRNLGAVNSGRSLGDGGYEQSQTDVDEKVGGIHFDGFLQPIRGRKSWKYPKRDPKRGGTSRTGMK